MFTWPCSVENSSHSEIQRERGGDMGYGGPATRTPLLWIVSGSFIYALPFSIAGWPSAVSSLSDLILLLDPAAASGSSLPVTHLYIYIYIPIYVFIYVYKCDLADVPIQLFLPT